RYGRFPRRMLCGNVVPVACGYGDSFLPERWYFDPARIGKGLFVANEAGDGSVVHRNGTRGFRESSALCSACGERPMSCEPPYTPHVVFGKRCAAQRCAAIN